MIEHQSGVMCNDIFGGLASALQLCGLFRICIYWLVYIVSEKKMFIMEKFK